MECQHCEATKGFYLGMTCQYCQQPFRNMKTLKQVTVTPVFVDTIPEKLEQGYLYISKHCKTSVHLCLCGCGERTIIPFNYELFPAQHWQMTETKKGISFIPSIGNYSFDCQSHYILTNNVANFV